METWIYCKDQLPTEHKLYLVSIINLNNKKTFIDVCEFSSFWEQWEMFEFGLEIYAWKELDTPAIYK